MWGHVGYFAKFVHDAEYYAALTELSITSGLYAIVIISLVLKRRLVSKAGPALHRYEVRVLIQAMTISFFIGFVLFTWYNFDSFVASTKWTFFAINMMWIVNCGINPILCMILNR
uniref:7TM_GPCR_Srx domain-containing protein n=1 Tax=Ascaris lumbricoides TaxID=6252 RepID=A0A0M3ISU4_ASCLU